jgi:uncharacterized protein (TIGR03067 family)
MNRAIGLMAPVAFVLSTALAATAQTAVSGDLTKLQGKWTAFLNIGGRQTRVVVEFKGNLVYTTMGNTPSTKPDTVMEVVIDETRSPKQIFLRNGQNVGAEPGSMLAKFTPPDTQAIYELDGDTWTTCTNVQSKEFPTKLAAGKGLLLSVYKRGELELPKAAPKGRAKADDGKTKTLKGVKVTNPQRTTATLVTAEGESIEVTTNHAAGRGYEMDGKKATQTRNFYNEGNVLDVILKYVGPKRPIWEIYEVHMISGVFELPAYARASTALSKTAVATPKTAAEISVPKNKPKAKLRPEQILKRATVGKSFKDYHQLFVDGEEVKIYADNPHAMSFDLSGKQIARQSAGKLLHEGNLVDVGFFSKHPAHPYYMLSEIHLIQGEIR